MGIKKNKCLNVGIYDMKKFRKKMWIYINFFVICICFLEVMIIWIGMVILDVNSGNEFVFEEMINNIIVINVIMVYFCKKCSIMN